MFELMILLVVIVVAWWCITSVALLATRALRRLPVARVANSGDKPLAQREAP